MEMSINLRQVFLIPMFMFLTTTRYPSSIIISRSWGLFYNKKWLFKIPKDDFAQVNHVCQKPPT